MERLGVLYGGLDVCFLNAVDIKRLVFRPWSRLGSSSLPWMLGGKSLHTVLGMRVTATSLIAGGVPFSVLCVNDGRLCFPFLIWFPGHPGVIASGQAAPVHPGTWPRRVPGSTLHFMQGISDSQGSEYQNML